MALDSVALKSGDVLGAVGLGNFNVGMGTIGTVFMWIFLCVFIVALLCAIIVYVLIKRIYNQKCWVFAMIGNKPTLKMIDTARFYKMGIAGDRLFKLRKYKRFVAPPTIQMGKDLWWFWERADGELINFGLDNLDIEMKRAGAFFVDIDMRMQRLGISKNLDKRFSKQNWFEKYAGVIAGVVFVILVTVALVVLFSRLSEVAKALDTTAQSVAQMAETVNKFYSKKVGSQSPNDVSPGGSGLVPVNATLALLFLASRWRVRKWKK